MKARHALGLTVLMLILSVTPAYAQPAPPRAAGFDLGLGADLSLELSPLHPRPGETVRVSAHSTLLDLSGATFVWYENSKKVAEGVGILERNFAAGILGSETRIAVSVAENSTEVALASARIRPTEIDLLWESDSYVPPFFRGRALPSAGTNLRLEAIPRFRLPNGSLVPVRDITFTWRKNGYVVASASGRGKSRVSLPSAPLFGADTISVEAKTRDGLFEGTASVYIPSIEPRLALYENHPLFGIMYYQALGARNFLTDIELSFAAVPYFAEALARNDGRLLYEWRVNGNEIANDADRPGEITIDARNSSGIALIELALSHATNFFLSASGSWGITFLGEGGLGEQRDPFGGNQ